MCIQVMERGARHSKHGFVPHVYIQKYTVHTHNKSNVLIGDGEGCEQLGESPEHGFVLHVYIRTSK